MFIRGSLIFLFEPWKLEIKLILNAIRKLIKNVYTTVVFTQMVKEIERIYNASLKL